MRDLGAFEAEGVPRGLDAGLDVGRLLVPQGRIDLKGLHRPRVDAADRDRRQRQQTDRHPRPGEVAHHRVGEHDDRDRDDDGDVDEHLLGRQQGVDPGRAGAVEPSALVVLQHQPAPVEPVGHRLEPDEQGHQGGQVRAGGGGDPVTEALEPDPTVEVVHRQRAQQRDHDRGEAHAEEEAQERVLEDVEARVDAEEGVFPVELAAVAEQHPVGPATLCRQPGEDSDQGGEQGDPQPHAGGNDHPVALQRRLLRGVRTQQRAQSVGQEQVGRHDQGHPQPEGEEQPHPGEEHPGEDLAVVDLPEPQQLGPQVHHRAEQAEQQEDPDEHGDGHLAAPAHPRHRAAASYDHDQPAPLVSVTRV